MLLLLLLAAAAAAAAPPCPRPVCEVAEDVYAQCTVNRSLCFAAADDDDDLCTMGVCNDVTQHCESVAEYAHIAFSCACTCDGEQLLLPERIQRTALDDAVA